MSIGDVNSTERGSGARYNDGKPDLSLIPLRMIADSFLPGDGFFADDDKAEAYDVMLFLGKYQETGDVQHLDRALSWMVEYWGDCARVFDYGRKKYAAWNWAKGMPWSVPLACAGRHLVEILRGNPRDSESGELHFGHVMCNVVMLRLFADTYPEGNDLPPPGLLSIAVDAGKALDMVSMDPPALPNDGWREWHGGKRPVATDARVDVVLRNKEEVHDTEAGFLLWSHAGSDDDIVAWRPAKSV